MRLGKWCRRVLARTVALSLLLASAAGASAPAEPRADRLGRLERMPIEELFELRITTVSKKGESQAQAASAVFVLTADDIRRSGMTSIPELLRLVPGLQVARISSHSWAITARGFNGQFASKLLVLIDGRSVYTPIFSGVWWNVQDVPLEDIDRIEVIRGPGATVWGANAVNGVINIITRSARETQGALVSGGGGDKEWLATARFGGAVGERFHYRVWGKYDDRDELADRDGVNAEDPWSMKRAGVRLEWEPTDVDRLTIHGSVHDGREHDRFLDVHTDFETPPGIRSNWSYLEGHHVLARWDRSLSDGGALEVQAYYDHDHRVDQVTVDHDIDTYDVEWVHRWPVSERHELTWGGGWRWHRVEMGNSFRIAFDPEERSDHIYSLFFQDEWQVVPERLTLIGGSKLSYNSLTEFEWQPSVRAAFTPTERQTFWAAASRSVRVPGFASHSVDLLAAVVPAVPMVSPPRAIRLQGDEGVEAEIAWTGELGWRGIVRSDLTLDLTAFYTRYDRLQSVEPGAAFVEPGPPLRGVVPQVIDDKVDGHTYGVELSARFEPREWLRFVGNYTFLQANQSFTNSLDTAPIFAEGLNPSHQASLRVGLDLPFDLELDTQVFYVGNLRVHSDVPTSDVDIPSYVRVDLRLGWRPIESLELAIFGENLQEHSHPEQPPGFRFPATDPERAVHAKATWRY